MENERKQSGLWKTKQKKNNCPTFTCTFSNANTTTITTTIIISIIFAILAGTPTDTASHIDHVHTILAPFAIPIHVKQFLNAGNNRA